jgi:hypothetical protein
MIRLLTAAAMVALLASPVMAQSVSPSDQSKSGSSSTLQNQGTTTSPGSSSSESMGTQQSPGLSGQIPADCLPNDPRPACQTAQLPSQDTPSAAPSTPGSTTYPAERGSSGSSGGSGMGGSGSGSSGSGTTGR